MDAKLKFSRLHFVEKISSRVTNAAGANNAIIFAFFLVVTLFCWGAFIHFSTLWQLIFNTTTNLTTFLMVFLIQKSQNKHTLAIHLKLNELVAANARASNRLVDVENMTEEELKVIQKYYSKLSHFIEKEDNLLKSHSIDEAEANQNIKDFKNQLTKPD